MITRILAVNALTLAVMASTGIGPSIAQEPAPLIQTFMQPDNLHELRQSEVLGIPTSSCHNVIDLMMTNRMRQQSNQPGTPEIHLPHLTVGTKTGDLELICVNLVCDGDHRKGPVFQIGMHNNSSVPIGNFRVSLVGIRGQIHVHSPTTTITIDRMECGEQKHIQVQLPVTCMSLPCAGGPTAFDSLVVAVDSCDELVECDELNNVQILKRCDIDLLAAEPAAPAESIPDPTPDMVAPEESYPLENLDLDKIDYGDARNLLFLR